MKLLITGICGFVGSTLTQTWINLTNNHVIYGLDNLIRPGSETNRVKLKKLGVHLYHADIRTQSDFATIPAVDWVIDAAANPSIIAGINGTLSSRQLTEHNLIGTLNLLEYCKTHKAGFVLLSTSRVYSISLLANLQCDCVNDAFRPTFDKTNIVGLTEKGISESFSTAPPISLYGASKLASEIIAQEYGHMFNFPVWINRCGVSAGAGQFGRPDQGIFSYWINSWRHKKPLKYIGFNGQGFQVRDCLHPKDIVPLLEKQINYTGKDRTIIQNVSGGIDSAMSLAQLSQWCKDRFGPHVIDRDLTPRPFDVPWLVLNSERAFLQWGWKPEISVLQILEEIAVHAEQNPDWLAVSSSS